MEHNVCPDASELESKWLWMIMIMIMTMARIAFGFSQAEEHRVVAGSARLEGAG